MKATLLEKRPAGFYPDAKMYELSRPFTYDGATSKFVVSSMGLVTILGADNWGVFLVDEDGRALNWASLTDTSFGRNPPYWISDL